MNLIFKTKDAYFEFYPWENFAHGVCYAKSVSGKIIIKLYLTIRDFWVLYLPLDLYHSMKNIEDVFNAWCIKDLDEAIDRVNKILTNPNKFLILI